MTTTGEDARPLPPIGQAVGQARASLTRLPAGTGPMLATIDRADLDTTIRTLE